MGGPRGKAFVGLCVVILAGVIIALREAPGDRRQLGRPGEGKSPGFGQPEGDGIAARAENDARRDPVCETATRGTDPVESPVCVLTVLNDLGTPVSGAHVALFRDDRLLSTGRTDGDGVARLAGSSEPCSLAVFPVDAGPFVEDLAEARREVTVRLPQWAVLSGRVVIDGAAPTSPLRIELETVDNKPPALWPRSIDRWIWEEVGHSPWFQTCVCDPAGGFRFAGLHAQSVVRLSAWRSPHLIAERGDERGVFVFIPWSNLLVNFRTSPRVTGRVVAFGTREPVAGAYVSATWSYPDGNDRWAGAQADGAGQFSLRIPTPREGMFPLGVAVEVRTARDTGMRMLDLPPESFAPERTLGDLELSATRLVSYLVTDRQGGAIVSALVRCKDRCRDHVAWIESRSAADGRGVIEVPMVAADVSAGALGFRTATLACGAAEDDVTIVLDAACTLRVRAICEGSTRAPDSIIRIEAGECVFDDDAGSWREWGTSGALTEPAPLEAGDDARSLSFRASDVRLSAIRPGTSVRMIARDPLSGAEVEQSAILAPGEQKSIDLSLPGKPRTVKGRVFAPDGTPVPWRSVRLLPVSRWAGEGQPWDMTARDGSFAFEAVLVDAALLQVEGTPWIRELRIPEEGLDVAVRLEEDHEGNVEVVDSRERPVSGAYLTIRNGAFFAHTATNQEGKARLSAVPSGDAVVEARYGNIRMTQMTRIPGATSTFHLPRFGSVELELSLPEGHIPRSIRLEPVGTSGPEAVAIDEVSKAIAGIIPGRYRVIVVCYVDYGPDTATIVDREIDVFEGRTTRVTIAG